MSPVIFI